MKLSLSILLLHMSILARITFCDETKASSAVYCTDLTPQQNVDVEQVLGIWYAHEVITHLAKPGEQIYESCIVIHIADITQQVTTIRSTHTDPYIGVKNTTPDYHYLRLMWDEQGKNLEYTLKYTNLRPGFWISSAPQNGTMTETYPYSQFAGTIQVIKAVSDHMVLTFCQSNQPHLLFSIILSRQPNLLPYDVLENVKFVLRFRKLSTQSFRSVCRGGTIAIKSSISTIIYMMLLFLFK